MALIIKHRSTGGAAGAPSSLKTGEIAYNMSDSLFYVGYGDDGFGVATSIKAFAAHDFSLDKLIPSGGTTGQVLKKTSNTNFAVGWANDEGQVYTASGDGIELSANEFSLNYTEIATGINLADYATDSDLTTGLAGKANTSHTHIIGDVTGLQGALDGKASTTHNHDATYAPISHTHGNADITALDASKLTGTIDVARLPVLPGQNQVIASSNIASLTAGEQSSIALGTIVTTSDGRRWVYSGAGSKTLEASYVELADVSPEWATIANKPSFATVATSGSYLDLSNRPTLATVATSGSYNDLINLPTLFSGAYNDLTGKPVLATVATSGAYADLTGKPVLATVATSGSYNDLSNLPTLGTIASQAASNVSITGGSITGTTIHGGVF